MEPAERWIAIAHALRGGRTLPLEGLLDEIYLRTRREISRATLMRDLKTMRTMLNAPIIYDRHGSPPGYRLDGDANTLELPGLWLSPDELRALLLCTELLGEIEPGLLRLSVDPLRERIRQLLLGAGYAPESLEGRAAIKQATGRRADPRIFAQVTEALSEGRVLEFDYHARYNDRTTRRRVDPLRLVLYRDTWYLLANDRDRRAWRIFSLDRIATATVTAKRARRVAADKITQRLRTGFGIFLAEQTQTAVLRFSPERARWVADERWHPEQKGKWRRDGSYDLSLPYGDATELIMEILRHGPEVEVIAPKALRDAVAELHRKAAARYAATST